VTVTTIDEETYSTVEVCRLTGATYRQLDYWCRTGRISGQPVGRGTGSGHRRRWTQAQVAEATLLYVASRYVNATLDEAVEILRKVRVVADAT
jgi:DNA-binding transcriptional MerR regulator